MSSITQEAVLAALKTVNDPELHKDLVTLNMIKDIKVEGTNVSFTVVLTTPACPLKAVIEKDCREAVSKIPGVKEVSVNFGANVMGRKEALQENIAPNIKNIIAVASGKGGVGKSTVSVNLALALSQTGARVGILDADIYGPSVPLMMGITHPAILNDGKKMLPPENYGVKVMSIAFFIKDQDPVMWRGPMLHGAIKQFITDVDWGELDYLIIDMPPGTGDAPMSLAQLVTVTGVVGVTTPQDVALLDSTRGLQMFVKLQIPILGIVENMSYFLCPHCEERTEIFSHGGGKKSAETFKVPLLGEVPINVTIREGGDEGKPVVVIAPDSKEAQIFGEIAKNLAARVSVANATDSRLKPNVSFSSVH